MKQIAVMTPLPVQFDNFTEYILKQCWNSLNNQFILSGDLIHVYFSSTPKLYDKYATYLSENFRLPYTLLEVKQVKSGVLEGKDARLPELVHHRNVLLNQGKKHDYALFLDSDVILSPNTIKTLISDQKDVSAGILPQARIASPIRIEEGQVQNADDIDVFLAFGIFDAKFLSVTWGNMQKADASDVVATACMLLSRKIMNDNRVAFRLFPLVDGSCYLGEDVGYCLSALRAGFTVNVNPTVFCGHMRRIQERLAAYLQVTNGQKCTINFLFWSKPL